MSGMVLCNAELHFLNLTETQRPTTDNYVRLAQLIYNTDPYIYPAMFGCLRNAEILIPQLMDNNDSMFQLSNCFVAMEKTSIIGLILWVRGSMDWSPELLRELSYRNNLSVSPFLEMVSKEYVDSYQSSQKHSTISLINVSVMKMYSGKGIGRELLKRFLTATDATSYELCVLQDNTRAVKLYKSFGFTTVETYNGFSIEHRFLPALRMERRVQKHES